jgi:hypothetical protein
MPFEIKRIMLGTLSMCGVDATRPVLCTDWLTWSLAVDFCDTTALRKRLRELVLERRRFGYRRLHIRLRRESVMVNHKKLYRL